MVLRASGCALAVAMSGGGSAFAHHSPAAYDMTTEMLIEGAVAEVAWKNPHVYLTIATTGPNGEPLLQEVEVGPVSAVRTYGLTEELVAPGSEVIVRANPNRRGEGRIARGLDVTTSDGVTYALVDRGRSTSPPPVDVPADGLAGSWVSPAAAWRGFGQATATWPLTEAGRAANASALAQDVPPFLGLCEPFPPPALTSVPGLRTIEVGDAAVVMRFDSGGVEVERTIHLDQASHPSDLQPTVQGHSIGRWEGETLVIDTVGFASHPAGVLISVPSGPEKHMVERLTLADDRLHLEYEFTLEDPEYLVEPVSYAMQWDHRPDLEPSDAPCDPDVARRFIEEAGEP